MPEVLIFICMPSPPQVGVDPPQHCCVCLWFSLSIGQEVAVGGWVREGGVTEIS